MRSPALKDVVRFAGAFGSIGWLENTMTPPAFAAAGPATRPCGVSATSVASAGAGSTLVAASSGVVAARG